MPQKKDAKDAVTYLIQGVFFQKRQGLGVAFNETGAVPVIRTGIMPFMFAGAFREDPENPGSFLGSMTDLVGDAELSHIILTENVLSFEKRYEDRNNVVRYRFRKQADGTWKGTWAIEGYESCGANCIVTPVAASFFSALEAAGTQCSGCHAPVDDDPGEYHPVGSQGGTS